MDESDTLKLPPKVTLPTHNHPLHRSCAFHLLCNGCSQRGCYQEDGYRCSECYEFFLHKECAESPEEIIHHPSHPQHPLLLFSSVEWRERCYFCGIWTLIGYGCSICEFNIDLGCARHPPPLHIEHPKVHQHPLTLSKSDNDDFSCHVCGYDVANRYPYVCKECDLFFHVGCLELSPEITHPSHPIHPLMLLNGPPDYADKKCCLCDSEFTEQLLYHCSICNFSLDLDCVRRPPPLSFLNPKTHEHKLSLMPRLISFTCDACGYKGDRSPYVCLQCNFVIHRECIDLPHVININRHGHRVSHTFLLGKERSNRVCGVCHRQIDWSYGAYSCSICPNYAVHSRCAVRRDVWDGRELEGVPEEIEDIEPFVKIAENIIKHFSHEEHNLRRNEDGTVCEETTRCKACIRPINPHPFYSCCMQTCDFVLHETCANLPRVKRHVLSTERLVLDPGTDSRYPPDHFSCGACYRNSSGFRYKVDDTNLDVICGSIWDLVNHKSHPHPLNLVQYNGTKCAACGATRYKWWLGCIKDDCEFRLNFECALLPETVKHKCDDHLLCLQYGEEEEEEASGEYWCDICEAKTDPKKWFYTCDVCGTTLHIKCVLGDFPSLMPGTISSIQMCEGVEFEVVDNNQSCRPICCECERRCEYSVILKTLDDSDRYICSLLCVMNFMGLELRGNCKNVLFLPP